MQNRVQIEIQSEITLPTWTIAHYLQQTEINYIRYVIVDEISRQAVDEFDLTRLIVAHESADLYPRDKLVLHDSSSGVMLTHDKHNIDKFWGTIRRNSRPMVYIRNDFGTYDPLYDIFGNQALTVRRLEVKSPFEAVFEGLASALPNLLYAAERERREMIGWENEQIGQSVRNLEDIVRTSQIINNPSTPEGVRIYAQDLLDQFMDAQRRLNKTTRVSVRRINEIV